MKITKNKVLILAGVLAIAAVGSTAALATTAAPEAANGRISACYAGNGSLWIASTCGSDHAVSWVGHNIQATVQPSGAFGNSYDVSTVTHPSTGTYMVTLKGAVSNCVETASLAFKPGDISIEQINTTQLEAQTYDASGALADQTFQFIMSCA